jgi:uncharacterized membrane protein YeaQ/YmgE (transglycosylase-associated protein family)
MGIIAWLILGLIAGFIASKVVNKAGEGVILDIVFGIVGALVGGFLFSALGATGVTGLNLYSIFVAILGAIVVLVIYHAIVPRWCMDTSEQKGRSVTFAAQLPG